MKRSSDHPHGMHSVPIKKALTTEHVQLTDHSTNNWFDLKCYFEEGGFSALFLDITGKY